MGSRVMNRHIHIGPIYIGLPIYIEQIIIIVLVPDWLLIFYQSLFTCLLIRGTLTGFLRKLFSFFISLFIYLFMELEKNLKPWASYLRTRIENLKQSF